MDTCKVRFHFFLGKGRNLSKFTLAKKKPALQREDYIRPLDAETRLALFERYSGAFPAFCAENFFQVFRRPQKRPALQGEDWIRLVVAETHLLLFHSFSFFLCQAVCNEIRAVGQKSTGAVKRYLYSVRFHGDVAFVFSCVFSTFHKRFLFRALFWRFAGEIFSQVSVDKKCSALSIGFYSVPRSRDISGAFPCFFLLALFPFFSIVFSCVL